MMTSAIDRSRVRVQAGHVLVLVLLATGALAAVLIFLFSQSGAWLTPQTVVKHYVANIYANDYSRAYELLSAADKAVKSREDYLQENRAFTGFTLEAARRLASYIEYREMKVERQGARATVRAKLVVPDGNTETVREILFAEAHPFAPQVAGELPEGERRALLERLDQLHESDQLPTFEVEQSFELVRVLGAWRIFENWAEMVRVHFSGEVKYGLPWEFEPMQDVVLAKPGDTLQALYRAKNLSDQLVTAKARHIDTPEEYLDSLNIIQCFCLIQQTLRPGEEAELPLVFRVAWDVPQEVKDFYVHYEFYPLESFPND